MVINPNERTLGILFLVVAGISLLVAVRVWSDWTGLHRTQQVMGIAGFLLWGCGYLFSLRRIRYLGMACVVVQGGLAVLNILK
jgi:hypothetical protein